MQVNEQAIVRAQERQAALDAEADRTLAEAKAQADLHLKGAREEAGHHVDSARLTAEKIRRESERELQAATARRDAITAQLTNVRQMLATLGGVSIVNPLADPEEAKPAGEPVRRRRGGGRRSRGRRGRGDRNATRPRPTTRSTSRATPRTPSPTVVVEESNA